MTESNSSYTKKALRGALKEESLREVDASLLEQIHKLAEAKQGRAQVPLKSKTAVLVINLPRDGRAGLLAYFAKHNDPEAGPLCALR